MASCNFKCLNCQNWEISQYPDNNCRIRGYVPPKELANECVQRLSSSQARLLGADRIFFSGGEATTGLPYIEEVVKEARGIARQTKVNFDTNGFLTEKSLERVLRFADSITYDLKAYHDSTHLALTGCPVGPVLRNAELLVREAKGLLWEFRILVIPGINEAEIAPLCQFIASLGRDCPTAFLAFRPNFVLEEHPGASRSLLDRCLAIARETGLTRVTAQGYTDIRGKTRPLDPRLTGVYDTEEARRAASYALAAGCHNHPRNCLSCAAQQSCAIKRYQASRWT